jgi:hypothetical protein
MILLVTISHFIKAGSLIASLSPRNIVARNIGKPYKSTWNVQPFDPNQGGE